METITTGDELRNAIQQLEYNKAVERQILRDSFNDTMESLKPVNIFKNIGQAFKNPSLLSNIIPAAMGLGASVVSNKIISGASSGSRIKKILISFALYGLTRTVVKNPEINKIFSQRLLHSFFGK